MKKETYLKFSQNLGRIKSFQNLTNLHQKDQPLIKPNLIILKKQFKDSSIQRSGSEERVSQNMEPDQRDKKGIFSPQSLTRKDTNSNVQQERNEMKIGRNMGFSNILLSPNGQSSKFLELKSVKDILFTHGTHANKKEQQQNQSLMKKCFKSLRKYQMLKLKVKAFLSDELNHLNQEFQTLQKQNIVLQERVSELSNSSKDTQMANILASKQYQERLIKLQRTCFNQLKIHKLRQKQLRIIMKLQQQKSLSRVFHFWDKQSISIKAISFYLNKSQFTTDISRDISPLIKKRNKHDQNRNTTTNTSQNKLQASLFTNSLRKQSMNIKDGVKNSQSTPKLDFTKSSKSRDASNEPKDMILKQPSSNQEPVVECFQEYYNCKGEETKNKPRFFDERFTQKLQRLKELERQTYQNNVQHYNIREEEIQVRTYCNSISNQSSFKAIQENSDNQQQTLSQYMGMMGGQQTSINPIDQSSTFLQSNRGDFFIYQFEKDSTQSSKNILAILENLTQQRKNSQNNILIEERNYLDDKLARETKQSRDFMFTPGFGEGGFFGTQEKKLRERIAEIEGKEIDETKIRLQDMFSPNQEKQSRQPLVVTKRSKRSRDQSSSYLSIDLSFNEKKKQLEQIKPQRKGSKLLSKKKFQDENADPNLQRKKKDTTLLEKLRF